MKFAMTRRCMIIAALASAAAASAKAEKLSGAQVQSSITELEHKHGGRLGVAILDAATGRRIEHRAHERFAMCSTCKFLAAAQVLARVDRGEEELDRRIVFAKDQIVTFSPVTERHVGGSGLSLAEICAAAITYSDNTAGNLLFESFGGPSGWTRFARSLGDTVSRLDRTEPALNEAVPGDPRDTTTPAAMLEDMHKVLLGDVLSQGARERLIGWLIANKTGGKRLRASLPAYWRAGDKTGSGEHGVANDIAVVWPPGRDQPVLIAAYYADSPAPVETRNHVLAEVGRMLVMWI